MMNTKSNASPRQLYYRPSIDAAERISALYCQSAVEDDALLTKQIQGLLQVRFAGLEQTIGTLILDFGKNSLRIDASALPVKIGPSAGDADCVVSVNPKIFMSILRGEQTAQRAFMAGKLHVAGSFDVAKQLRRVTKRRTGL